MGDSNLHALLSPSGASRWLACTPSARLEQQFPDTSGDAAREGTMAHAICEISLKHELGLISYETYERHFDELRQGDMIPVDGELKPEFYCAAMFEYCEQYVTFVLEQLAEARKHTPSAQIYIEKRLDLSAYAEDCFGTGDVGIIANGVLHGIDLKYGKGVEVSAINNSQGKIYGLGWLSEFGMEYDIHTLRFTIFQPRIDNYSTWEISVSDLLEWAETELRPKAILAFAGEGDFVPGNHCMFCKVKLCKARADYQLELAQYEFAEGKLLSDAEVSDILKREKAFTKWVKSIADYALEQAVHKNKHWPDFKLVLGRSNRSYVSDDRVLKALLAKGVDEVDLYKPREIIGITALETLLGEKKVAKYLHGLIVKPPGSCTLVPLDDKREEYNSLGQAAADFADELVPEFDPEA